MWKQYRDTNYEVSDRGEVRKKKTKKIMKQHYKYNGKKENDYKHITLQIGGKRVKKIVHRMVAEEFIENPNNYPQINHKNNKKDDNRVENLEWCTNDYNLEYAYKHGEREYVPKVAVTLIKDGINLEFESKYGAAKWLKETEKIDKTIKYISKRIDQSILCKCKVYVYRVR